MAVHCDVCGIEALESQEFALERVPFRRAKRYCPACHRRFYTRVYAIVALLSAVLALFGFVDAWRGHKPFLQAMGIRYACLIGLQWLMVLPHELGHALVGRWLGYKQIRILVGAGRPLFSVNLFGFPWLFNLIPLGGLTLPGPGTRIERWKHFKVVAAGPMVNLLAAGLGMLFANPGWLREGLGTWSGVFIGANLLVVGENLFPHVAQTPMGPLGTDGYQLWHLLFRWNKPISSQPEKVPLWELALCHVLKWLVLLVTASACLLLGFAAAYVAVKGLGVAGLILRIFIVLVVGALSLLCGWFTVRLALDPISKFRKRYLLGVQPVSLTPEQIELINRGNEEFSRKQFAAAEEAFDRLLTSMPERNSDAFVQILLGKLKTQLEQGHIERAESACLRFVAEAVNKEHKLKLLDGFACRVLYRPSAPWLNQAERLARLGLEIVPGTLTLKGTLGGILAEQGQFTEAEPLIRECLERSPAHHDQGISSFYLGVIKLHEGKVEEAKRLIEHATTLHPEPWLLAKAAAKLAPARAAANSDN